MLIVDRGTWGLRTEDEERHPAGDGRLWNESYYLDFAAADGSVAGYVRLGLYPNWGLAWYWACLVRPGRPLVMLADHHAPLPEGDLTVRGDGYVAGHKVGAAFEAMSVTLDAGAAAVLDRPYQDPGTAPATPFALDLTWHTAGGVYGYDLVPRYEIPCEVRGTIRAGDEEIAFSGYGERDHSWGERDWWRGSWLWTSGRLGDGTFLHGTQANAGFALPWPSFLVPSGGVLDHCEGFTAGSRFADDGLPEGADLSFGGMKVTVTPVAFAPVTLTSPEGETARFPRALCRFSAADGREGHGWTEWHQPPDWRDHGWRPLG